MAVKPGRIAKVCCGTYTVAEMGTWSMGGLTNETLDSSGFGTALRTFEFGLGDSGAITFSGFYDPTDTTGQSLIKSAALNKSKMQTISFFIDSTSYWTLKTSGNTGNLLITKADAITMEFGGLGRIDFEGKISGEMILI